MTSAFLAGYLMKEAADPNPGHAGIYGAMQAAETGSSYEEEEPERWIRTRGGNSTAYGPVQIGSMLGDYTREGNPAFYKTLSERQAAYMDKLHHQRAAFKRYGGKDMVPGKERFDYGREGIAGSSPQDKMLYHQVASKIMRDVMRRKGGTLAGLKKGWKGTNMPWNHSRKWNNRFDSHMDQLGF